MAVMLLVMLFKVVSNVGRLLNIQLWAEETTELLQKATEDFDANK